MGVAGVGGEDCVNIRCCDAVVCVGAVQIVRGVSFDCCAGDWVVISSAVQARTSALLRMLQVLCPEPKGRVWALDASGPGVAAGAGQTDVRDLASVREQALAWLEKTGLGDGAPPGPGRRDGAGYGFATVPVAPPPRPQVLILDKPMAWTDSRSARIVLSAVRDLIADGSTVVIACQRQDTASGPRPGEIIVERRRVASICA
jgi:ABC-type histidine transport system ATPase subunit